MKNLKEQLAASIDRKIETSAPKSTYSRMDHTRTDYVRDEGCWAAGLKPYCVSPWNSATKNQAGVTLISPRHVISVRHLTPRVGAQLRFVTEDNRLIVRKLIRSDDLGAFDGSQTIPNRDDDLTVGLLETPILEIAAARIMPETIYSYLENLLDDMKGIPALYFNQDKNALIGDIIEVNPERKWLKVAKPAATSQRAGYFSPVRSGDSGHPLFLALDGALVFVGVLARKLDSNGDRFMATMAGPLTPMLTELMHRQQSSLTPLEEFFIGGDYQDHHAIEVVWTDVTGNVRPDGNSLIRGGGANGWDSGAASSQMFSGNGAVEFRAAASDKYIMCGLSESNLDARHSSIDHAIQLRPGGGLWIYERGEVKAKTHYYNGGDTLAVKRMENRIYYQRNQSVVYIGDAVSTQDLIVDCSLHTVDAVLENVRIFRL